jgi:hypothetical protein
MEDVDIIQPVKIVGNNHLRFRVKAGQNKAVDVIGFGMGDLKAKIENAIEPVSLAFVIENNSYYGFPQLQLRLKDIKIGDWRK